MPSRSFEVGKKRLSLQELKAFVFSRSQFSDVTLSQEAVDRIQRSHHQLLAILEEKKALYGVTTGLGDSCHRYIEPETSAELALNLVRYLGCGTGALLSQDICRAVLAIHFVTLSQGFSAVSPELMNHMKLFLENDWSPVIPREGSLGASGDLVPLSYLARAFVGEADVYTAEGEIVPSAKLLKAKNIAPYKLKSKEGLSLVNGVSTMAGHMLVNIQDIEFLAETSALTTSWLCMALGGRREAFGPVINSDAKSQSGQTLVAQKITQYLDEEGYSSAQGLGVPVKDGKVTENFIQDRYSLRCTPQVLGPLFDTLDISKKWLENEINACSDNPVISPEGNIAMGGNFYGGYLSLGTDYLKIAVANMVDLIDRQLMLIIDDKSNRGLPPNLAAWGTLAPEKRHLLHGLKGLHQAASAITSEVMPKAVPNSIFSRSSESHNQDKVSLGMSACTQCADMLDQAMRVQMLHLVVLAQALDLRGIKLKGHKSKDFYNLVRSHIPFVENDKALGEDLHKLEKDLRRMARSNL